MDENVFFKEATLRICSSLDIEIALGRCREFLSRHIPADDISLNMYNPATGSVKYLARANRSGGERLDLDVKLSSDLVQSIESGQRLQDYLVVNQPSQDPFARHIPHPLGLENASYIALRLIIEGKRLGVADLFAYGENRFTEHHARLFCLLREPFAIAMANAVKHQETVELKDRLASDNRYLNKKLYARPKETIIGARKGLFNAMLLVEQVANLDSTVLILGETGVGKEVIANAIHRYSPRRNGPFIKVNCGAISESLIDSELFGHEKGAFTGATRQTLGLLERADTGTIFLDEIGELPLPAQIRLLRVLQSREIVRVGGTAPVFLDIRIIAATHRNLENMVKQGRFREDLWFRINVFPIPIPPLRQRREDIEDLITHFIRLKSKQLGLRQAMALSQREIDSLVDYDWPGNVRELENVIERTLIQKKSNPLLPVPLTGHRMEGLKFMDANVRENLMPGLMSIDDMLSQHIQKVLAVTGGKINGADGAAAILKIHPNTLRNRMNKLGIPFGRGYKPHRSVSSEL